MSRALSSRSNILFVKNSKRELEKYIGKPFFIANHNNIYTVFIYRHVPPGKSGLIEINQ